MNKTLLVLALGFASVTSAQAADVFTFTGGGATVNSGLSAPSGSWFSMLAMDTDSDFVADSNLFTAIRAAGTTGIPGPNGSLDFSVAHTAGQVDRTWSFFNAPGSHYNNQVLEVTGSGNTLSVDMSGWTVYWNGGDIDMGAGAAATINNNDGIWGNGNDTLDYSAIVPAGGFAGVAYALHLTGSYTPSVSAVPVPAAAWLLGSGLLGLVGVARRKVTVA